jgi:hypothetical protein
MVEFFVLKQDMAGSTVVGALEQSEFGAPYRYSKYRLSYLTF